MNITNLSAEPDWKLRQWLPQNAEADNVIFFPDACPGKSPLPTGTATHIAHENWRPFALSDCGCGMRLLRSHLDTGALAMNKWEAVTDRLRSNKGKLGDLGGGNHFLDALSSYNDDRLYFLIHTGSRNESGLVDDLVDTPKAFDKEFDRIVEWARQNREAVEHTLEKEFGKMELVLDLPHNTYEAVPEGGAIIRKGAVHIQPGEVNVLPSHLSGDVALVTATKKVEETLFSLSHGTGRAVPRSEAKLYADSYDFEALRKRVLIPDSIGNDSLRTDGPYAYRDLDECLALLDGYVEVTERFAVVGYIGHV